MNFQFEKYKLNELFEKNIAKIAVSANSNRSRYPLSKERNAEGVERPSVGLAFVS
jgi:hypothetical protein|tara:strand:- start:440 stop:604 length:165 start_codon:yes stop_codon:yes gene_type:complete